MKILVICTANRCRSPMAERLLRARASHHGVDAEVTSAGLHASGKPPVEGAVKALAAHGLDLDDHTSRQIDEDLVRGADLVLGMESRHVQEAALLAPDRFHTIYTMRELVVRAGDVGPVGESALEEWLHAVSEMRSPADVLSMAYLDVLDPFGGPEAGYFHTAAELAELATAIGAILWKPGSGF